MCCLCVAEELAAANSLRLVKTFTMRNTGQLPVHVLSMGFAGYGCSNYGFVVENCSSDFVLEPNATKDVRVRLAIFYTNNTVCLCTSFVAVLHRILQCHVYSRHWYCT